MVEMQTHTSVVAASAPTGGKSLDRRVHLTIPPSSMPTTAAAVQNVAARLRNLNATDTFSPVNQNGSFEFDRVIKSGYVQKRAQKTKTWKTVYLVLRPNTLSIYKSDKEDKLRHKIYLSDLTAVTLLKDPKHKKQNMFGLFSPAKNFQFQANTLNDAQTWVEEIRRDARIEEEEEEMFLASPVVRRQSYMPAMATDMDASHAQAERERLASSSPEPAEPPARSPTTRVIPRPANIDSSGLSGNELASHSDFSDTDIQQSIENLAVHSPPGSSQHERPSFGARNMSQASGLNLHSLEQDPDRVIWQGWVQLLRSKGGMRQWKKLWAVLRPRNLILYKDETEYTAQFIVQLPSVLNVVEIDPVSKSKTHCLQIITEEKSYRLCAHDEESLVQCLGAFKSLLSRRKELQAKAAAAAATATANAAVTATSPA